MGFIYSVVGFLLAIGILVTVHEFGHFWVARKLGVKVLQFSIGFGKPLWSRVSGVDQIEYRIGRIPLGGYVKMLGQGDVVASGSGEAHRAFDNQPIWKRSLIVLAGPGINFIFAILLFVGLGLVSEQRLVPEFGEIPVGSALSEAGIQTGDVLLKVDSKPAKHLLEHDLYIFNQVLKREKIVLTVTGKDGERIVTIDGRKVPIYKIDPGSLMRQLGFARLAPPISTEISQVSEGSPAELAGILAGDQFLEIEGVKIEKWQDLVIQVVPSPGKPLNISLDRDGVEFNLIVTPKAISVGDREVGQLGVQRLYIPYPEHQLVDVSRSPAQALVYGVEHTWLMSNLTLRMLWKMVTLQVSHKNVNGPITIADVAGQAIQIGWQTYLLVLAAVSISLGVMNLLPIPMLDGGHILMYMVEVVAGKKVSEKVFAVGQRVGVLLLIGLMSLAFYNDIFRLLN